MKILVIDDNAVILDVTATVLEYFGHSVETADGGKLGIRKFEGDTFDMVITDIMMPDLDGESVARYIRNGNKNPAWIVAMSATPWKASLNHFDAFLEKPFSIQELANCVDGFKSPQPS